MRGKGKISLLLKFRRRITPAYAGKRALAAVRTPIVRDHPRLCGEKFELFMIKDHPRLCGEKANPLLVVKSNVGSPPPMRGKGTKPN